MPDKAYERYAAAANKIMARKKKKMKMKSSPMSMSMNASGEDMEHEGGHTGGLGKPMKKQRLSGY